MKKIEAIIRSSKFEEVKNALSDIGIDFFTFMEVKGYGKQKGDHVVYRGAEYDVGYISRLKIELVTTHEKLQDVVDTILVAARDGIKGDGKIIISDIEQMISIRTGKSDSSAL